MSIAVIVDTFPRWSERFIARELNELLRRGLNLRLYCLRAGAEECAADPDFAPLMPFRVVLPFCFLPSRGSELGGDAAAQARIEKAAEAIGSGGYRQISCANTLVRLMRENQTRAVYAHFASLPSTLGWLSAEALKLPFLFSAHARDVFVDAQLLPEKIAAAQHVFTCNHGAFERLNSQAPPGRVTLMRHGLPLKQFVFEPPAKIQEPAKLLCAGRLVEKKGFDRLLDALATPVLQTRAWNFTLAGDGPLLKPLTKQVRQLKLGERVKFAGAQPTYEKLLTLFRASDALLVPSRETEDGDREGTPNVILEAFALGVPVIGALSGSAGDALNNVTGTLIPGTSSEEIARGIEAFFDNRPVALSKTRAARKCIEERYDIERNIEPLWETLRNF